MTSSAVAYLHVTHHSVPREQGLDNYLLSGSVGSLRILLELGFRGYEQGHVLGYELGWKLAERNLWETEVPKIKEGKDEEEPHVLSLECWLHGAWLPPVKGRRAECGLVPQQRASRQGSNNLPVVGTSRVRGEDAAQQYPSTDP